MISPETLTVRVVGSNLTSLVGYRLLMTLWWFTLWVLKYCQQNHYVGDFHYVSFWNGVFWVFRIFEDFIFFEAIMSRKIVIPPENHKSRKKICCRSYPWVAKLRYFAHLPFQTAYIQLHLLLWNFRKTFRVERQQTLVKCI